jgi:hypothetical protein
MAGFQRPPMLVYSPWNYFASIALASHMYQVLASLALAITIYILSLDVENSCFF